MLPFGIEVLFEPIIKLFGKIFIKSSPQITPRKYIPPNANTNMTKLNINTINFNNVKLIDIYNKNKEADKIIKLENVFGRNLIKLFPNAKIIEFSDTFNKEIMKDTFNENVEVVSFGKAFNNNIAKNTLPSNIISLEFKNKLNNNLILDKNNIPPNLIELIVPKSCKINYIPRSLGKLIIDGKKQDINKYQINNIGNKEFNDIINNITNN